MAVCQPRKAAHRTLSATTATGVELCQRGQNRAIGVTAGHSQACSVTICCDPMPIPAQLCPVCRRPNTRLLGDSIRRSVVNFHACDGCNHIWTTAKETGEFIGHVTPLREPKDPATN